MGSWGTLLTGGTSATTLNTTLLASGALANVVAKNQVVVYTDKQLGGVDASKITVNGATAQSATYENVALKSGTGTTIYGAKVTINLTTAGSYGSGVDASTGKGIQFATGAFTSLNGTLSDGITAAGASGTSAAIENTNATTWDKITDKIAPTVAKDASQVAQVWAFDHGPLGSADAPDGKTDTIVVKLDEPIKTTSVAVGTFTVENFDVTDAKVIDTLNETTFDELDSSLSAADGANVVLTVAAKAGVTIGSDAKPKVATLAPVRDLSNNEGTLTANAIDKANPVLTAAKITIPGTTATDWKEVGDELTLTYSENVVLSFTDADTTLAGIQLSDADVNALLGSGTIVGYNASTKVTAVVDGKTVRLTISGDVLSTEITTSTADLKGTASPSIKDAAGNTAVANGTALTVTN